MGTTSVDEFEKQWRQLAKEIGKKIISDSRIAEIKNKLEQNGFLTEEEKSAFIVIADKIKYDVIYAVFGAHDTEGFKQFEDLWQRWLGVQEGVDQEEVTKSQENSNHFMYGSTPDPEKFLREFEPEIS